MTATTETTEVVLANGATVLVSPEFAQKFPAIAPDDEARELLEANLGEDADIGFTDIPRIVVPPEQFKSWPFPDGSSRATIDGIIIAHKRRRHLWEGADDTTTKRLPQKGVRPVCASVGGKVPLPGGWFAPGGERETENPGGTCETCPMKEFDTGFNGGPACGESILLFVMVEGSLLPIQIQVPRTSLKAVRTFMTGLIGSQLPFYGVQVSIGLEQKTSKSGQVYNVVTLTAVPNGRLSPDERVAAKLYGDQLKAMVEKALLDFAAERTADDNGIAVGDPQE